MKNIEQKIASLRIGKHHIVKKNRHRPPLPAKPFSLRIFPTTKDYLGDISVLSTYWKRGSHFCFGDRPNPFLLECAQIFQRQKSLKIILSLQPESSLLFIFYINKNQLGQERRNVFVFNFGGIINLLQKIELLSKIWTFVRIWNRRFPNWVVAGRQAIQLYFEICKASLSPQKCVGMKFFLWPSIILHKFCKTWVKKLCHFLISFYLMYFNLYNIMLVVLWQNWCVWHCFVVLFFLFWGIDDLPFSSIE